MLRFSVGKGGLFRTRRWQLRHVADMRALSGKSAEAGRGMAAEAGRIGLLCQVKYGV